MLKRSIREAGLIEREGLIEDLRKIRNFASYCPSRVIFSTEITECVKKGLSCPNKTTCTKVGNDSYDCACNKGFKMIHELNYTCEGMDHLSL